MTYIRDIKTGEVIKVLEVRMFEPHGTDGTAAGTAAAYQVEFLKDDVVLMRVRKADLLETLEAKPK